LISILPIAHEKEPSIRIDTAKGLIINFIPDRSLENIIKITPMIPAVTQT
jgi:hypothetical protein